MSGPRFGTHWKHKGKLLPGIELVIETYEKHNRILRHTAKELDVSPTWVRRALHKHGVPTRSAADIAQERRPHLTREQCQEIIKANEPRPKVSKELGMSVDLIKRFMKEYGLEWGADYKRKPPTPRREVIVGYAEKVKDAFRFKEEPTKLPKVPVSQAVRERGKHQCAWIFGDPTVEHIAFCDQSAAEGTSWCKHHLIKVSITHAEREKNRQMSLMVRNKSRYNLNAS